MPASEIIASQRITTKMLVWHERNGESKGKTAVNQGTVDASGVLQYATLGETITQGKPLAIGSDGKMYIASNAASQNKPAIAIAAEDGIAGDVKKIWTFGKRKIIGASFTAGSTVFLGAGALTTDLPLDVSGNIVQSIGIAASADELMINIEQQTVIV
jgi:hypothetical protein